MAARGLRQEDLSTIVPQSNLSAILAGKLGGFSGVRPAVFVPKSTNFSLDEGEPDAL